MLCDGCSSQAPLHRWSDRDMKQPDPKQSCLGSSQHPKRKKGEKREFKAPQAALWDSFWVRKALTWDKHLASSCPMSLWSCATPSATRNDFSAWVAVKVPSSSASRRSTVRSRSASSGAAAQTQPRCSATQLHSSPGGDKKSICNPQT